MNEVCTLCKNPYPTFHYEDKNREYWDCPSCGLIFVPARFHLTLAEEKARYDLHENHPADIGHRRFLSTTLDPLHLRLIKLQALKKRHMRGLDYGCGHHPTVSVMMGEIGIEMDNYDPFYFPEGKKEGTLYDFITCTEAIEHTSNPRTVLQDMLGLLDSEGIIAISTERFKRKDFPTWYYKNDPTHVCFFQDQTMECLPELFPEIKAVELIGVRTALLWKGTTAL